MVKIIKYIVSIISIFLSGSVFSEEYFGDIPSSFENVSGSLVYTIPIDNFIKESALEFELGLINTSRGNSSSIVGKGALLNGLEVVHECPKNTGWGDEKNGKPLCINGIRLFLLKGEKLDNNSVYHLLGRPDLSIKYSSNAFTLKNRITGLEKVYLKKTSGGENTWPISSRNDSFGNKVTYNYKRINYSGGVDDNNYHSFPWLIKTISYDKYDYEFEYKYGKVVPLIKNITIKIDEEQISKYSISYNKETEKIVKVENCRGNNCLDPIEFIYHGENSANYVRYANPHTMPFPVYEKILFHYKNISNKYTRIDVKENRDKINEFYFSSKRRVGDFYDYYDNHKAEKAKKVVKIDERVYLLTSIKNKVNGKVTTSHNYSYGDGFYDKNKGEIQGFNYINEVQNQKYDKPINIITYYNTKYPFTNLAQKVTKLYNGKKFEEIENHYIEESEFEGVSFSKNIIQTKIKTQKKTTYDDRGNIRYKSINLNDYISITDDNTGQINVLKELDKESFIDIYSEKEVYSKSTYYDYNSSLSPKEVKEEFYSNGRLDGTVRNTYTYYKNKIATVKNFENEILKSTKTDIYNQNGTLKSTLDEGFSNAYSVVGAPFQDSGISKLTQYEYEDKNIVKEIYDNGSSIRFEINKTCNLPERQYDISNEVVHFIYDGFCNLIEKSFSDGRRVSLSMHYSNDADTYVVKEQTSNSSPDEKTYLDGNLEVIKRSKVDYSGNVAYQDYKNDVTYKAVSNYYYSGEQAFWNETFYTPNNNIREYKDAKGSTKYLYIDKKTIKIDSKGHETITEYDAKGFISSVRDASVITYFKHNFIGNLIEVENSRFKIVYTYSPSGLLLSSSDPVRGVEKYNYDSFSNLTYKLNNNTREEVTYDKFDRIINITRGNVEGTKSEDIVYEWDSIIPGKLSSVTRGDFKKNIFYNSNYQIEEERIEYGNDIYKNYYSYDNVGRINLVTYPNDIELKKIYNDFGYLSAEKIGSKILWQIDYLDPYDRIVEVSYGNGVKTKNTYAEDTRRLTSTEIFNSISLGYIKKESYSYDSTDNLILKNNELDDSSTYYSYDYFNRLLMSKSDKHIERTSYDDFGNIKQSNGISYSYSSNSSGYQVDFFDGDTFKYDLLGNIVEYGENSIEWNLEGKPSKIYNADSYLDMRYDSDGKLLSYGNNDEQVFLLGNGYQITNSNGHETSDIYIGYGDIHLVKVSTKQDSGENTYLYLHSDRLGSIDTMTDEAGLVKEKVSYSSFGESYSTEPKKESLTTKGYTGHTTLAKFGLVHMQGRVYFPKLKRFLSADPIVNDTYNLQSYNRYSYVLNNPLKYTDPSGFTEETTSSTSNISWSSIRNWFSSTFSNMGRLISGTTAYQSIKHETTIVVQTAGVVYDVLKPSGEEMSVIASTGLGTAFSPLPDEVLWAGGSAVYITGRALVKTPQAYSEAKSFYKLSKKLTPNQIGQAGEAAVKAAFDIGEKQKFMINGRKRIPDGITSTTLSEVKNVAKLSFTRQLRDFADIAAQQGLQYDLYIRPSTELSGPLMEAIEAGTINVNFIPGAK